jgi:hypothetical protein
MKNNKNSESSDEYIIKPMLIKKKNYISTLPASSELYVEAFKKDNPDKKYKKKYNKSVKTPRYLITYYIISTVSVSIGIAIAIFTFLKSNNLHIIKKKAI